MSRRRRTPEAEGQLSLFAATPPSAPRAPANAPPARPLPPVAPQPPPAESSPEGLPPLPSPWKSPAARIPAPGVATDVRTALRLERNLALAASAGTGKTYSLVTMCLHLLSGARAGLEPVPAARLGLLTFTDKAAGEMRERLRLRLERLAEASAADAPRLEPELEASFEALGRSFPKPAEWRRLRDELGAATIGTFHSLCTQMLRRAPAGSGINTTFELMEDRDAKALLAEVAERAVLEAIARGDDVLRAQVEERGLGGDAERGLVDALAHVVMQVREEGVPPEQAPITDFEEVRRDFDAAVAALKVEVETVQLKPTSRQHESLAAFREAALQLSKDTYLELRGVLRGASRHFGSAAELKGVKKYVSGDEPHLNLDLNFAGMMVAPHEAALRELVAEIIKRYERALDDRGALDFTALLLRTRHLLAHHDEARLEAQGRFGALLVDEFQDTNRVQLDIVLLLSEARQGAPRKPHDGPFLDGSRWPLEPAFLAVVGDRKQAIYEFRGADVTVFERMARAIEANGGGRAYLKTSWRTSPRLVSALNAMMTHVMEPVAADDRLSFEVAYVPAQDDLVSQRSVEVSAPPVVQLLAGEELDDNEAVHAADADALARFAAALLASPEPRVVEASKQPNGAPTLRPPRGGDVALLFRRFSEVERYRQALIRHGVRHRIIRGRGFYDAQEVVDLASLLLLVADPLDALALAAVLRSPLVALADASLARLALTERKHHGLSPGAVLWGEEAPALLAELERGRLLRFRETFDRLRRERDRLGLRALLEVAMRAVDYRVAVAGAPFGEQALANIDKLLQLAAHRERDGVSVAAFARELKQLADSEPSEAQGEVLDDLDADAVTLCTVHQAKGLEWPIVLLPDLTARTQSDSDPLRFDRDAGLALKPWATEAGDLDARHQKEVQNLKRRRGSAETKRLIYVAVTRARDLLVLGLFDRGEKGTWARQLDDGLALVPRELVQVVDAKTLQPGAPLAAPEGNGHPVARAIERVRQAPPPQARAATLPVTQLEEFLTCPRRFHFPFQVGLAEHPHSLEWREDEGDEAPVAGDPRARGSAAHKLLELTPLDTVGTKGLAQTLELLRRSEGLMEDEEVLSWVTGFWATKWGKGLKARAAGVQRELPFMLRLSAKDGFTLYLKGQIDLLVADGKVAEVVDYKSSVEPKEGLAPYAFQLGCYALAARRLVGEGVPVRAGIAFLRERDESPRFLDAVPDAAKLEAELVEAARALTRHQVESTWPGRPLERCKALGCGYVYRCHPH